MLLISTKGIFVLTALGNEGTITGDVNSELWINKNVEEYVLKNPLVEKRHVLESISDITSERNNVHGLVVFTKGDITNLVNNNNDVCMIDNLKELLNNLPEVISENDLVLYYNAINNYLERED